MVFFNLKTKELFCARDRIGKKPFVYAETHNGFVFSSEIPAISKNSKMLKLNLELDNASIFSMFGKNFRQISEPNTIYKNIKKIKPGHGLIVKRGKIKKIFQWWYPKNDKIQNLNFTPENLRNLLENAVKKRCKADVEVGSFLSGGVDSSSISYIANKTIKNDLKTYALGFDKQDEDLIRARAYSKIIKSDHSEFYFDPIEQWNTFINISKVNGEPLPLLPLVHSHFICSKVKEDGIKVMLSGIGADELFFGYTGMINTLRISIASKLLYPLMNYFSDFSFLQNEIGSILTQKPGYRKSNLYKLRSDNLRKLILKDIPGSNIVDYNNIELQYWGQILPNDTYINESSFLGLMIENSASVAISGDIPAMMNGVEVRCPFLDNEIIKFAFNCNWNRKIHLSLNHTIFKKDFERCGKRYSSKELTICSKERFWIWYPRKRIVIRSMGKIR